MKRKNVSKYFGCMVFDDRVMKASLSAKVYQSLRKTRSVIYEKKECFKILWLYGF